MDPGAVLDNIIYAHATTSEHQYNLLLGLAAKMSEEPFKLLVRHCLRIKPYRFSEVWMVDPCECLFQIVHLVIALFQVDFTGRELAERQQKLAQMLSCFIKIAEESNVAGYMTNQVVADPGRGVSSDPMKPAGGHVLARAAMVRLMFRKVRRVQHVSKVFDAPNVPEAEAMYFLCQIFLWLYN
ncbi:hypothetical protein EUGRSUZ_B00968 [Eucalyptus grandis]|uniref:Uncharacterized protein n=2 Tax=Eucalyptus grandis TaxID=71139 RepID=A0ACC3LQQ5_EUCGR|nr:hypothetical protein EUGRSUZ_B00968 [Eucalyptus grandis]